LYRAAAFILGADDAEEIVQDAFERAMRVEAFFADVADPAAWLRVVVVRLAISRARRRTLWNRLKTILSGPSHEAVDHLDLQAAIDRLPANQRGAILLRYYFGANHAEIASALGLRESSVGRTLDRAKKSLRETLR
jgi:RNA polymerase sigma factor (sigma-70 family)